MAVDSKADVAVDVKKNSLVAETSSTAVSSDLKVVKQNPEKVVPTNLIFYISILMS